MMLVLFSVVALRPTTLRVRFGLFVPGVLMLLLEDSSSYMGHG